MNFGLGIGHGPRGRPIPRPKFVLASDRAAQVTGIVFPIDGGTTARPSIAQTKLIMSTAQP